MQKSIVPSLGPMLAVPPSQREMAPYLQVDFSLNTPSCGRPSSQLWGEKATFGFYQRGRFFKGDE